jgi:uncharacterized repeat protein (TIGR01451 family)
MSLDDLEKKIYDPDFHFEGIKHEDSQFDPFSPSSKNADSLKKEKTWEKIDDAANPERKKILKLGTIVFGAIVIIAALITGYVKFTQSAFSQERVSIKIEGPTQSNGLENSIYKIIFKNDNRASLNNAEILLSYPENFKPKESQNLKIDNLSSSRILLGTIKGYSTETIEISGTFFAAKDSIIYLNATLEYVPSNLNAKFQSKNQLGININSSPLILEIQAPSEIASGNKVDYVISFRNISAEYFDGVRLKVDYSEGFSFISSDLAPSEGNGVWYLGSLKPNQDGKIVVTGNIQGSGDESKIIKAYLGYEDEGGNFIVYNQKETTTKITSTILSIKQYLSEQADLNVDAGKTLKYTIEYKNNGDIALRDAIVTEEIDSRVLDFSKLDLKNGSYNASRKVIIWRASEIPGLANLAPGDSGKISFSIPVMNRIPIENDNDKNFSIVSTAKIDSPSIPSPIGSNKIIASNTITLKLNSRVVLGVEGYYKDSVFENSGPIPPKVGQETSYTIHWKIINVSNNINDVKVVSSIPSGVKWLGKISPSSEAIIFNERTNQIEWNLGNLNNGVGISKPVREASFQISIVPQINQIRRTVLLLNSSILTAKDDFTGVDVRVEIPEKDNRLTEDPSVNGR